MPISIATLTSGGGSAATSHNTASVSPTANRLLLLWVHCYRSSGSAQPTAPGISGNGLTWEQVGTDTIVDNSGSDRASLFLFRAMSATTPSAGAITITPDASEKATWILDEIDGVATGANGANAVVQFVNAEPGSTATVTATLATFGSNSNAGIGGMASQNTGAKTWNNSWTKDAEVTTNSVTGLTTGYRLDGTQLTVSVTGTAARCGLIAIELAAAGAAGAGVADLISTSVLGPVPDATYPGSIGGVEPESHAHNPVYVDSNNNMYRITESSTESGNHPMAWKSIDGGKTWFEVDSAHRPSTQDMEGTWGMKVGTDIYYTTNRDDTVWLDVFHMSDSGTPDTWGLHETIDSSLTSTGVEQWASFVRLSDGTFWMFYSDTMAGSNQQIAYRKRTGTNTYGTKVAGAFGSTSVSECGPSPVLGASDKTHLFYTDQTNNHVYYRTLTSAGTLSGATQIDASGSFNFSTSPGRIAHTNPIYYDASGTEVIGVMFADTAGILKYASIRNGVVQTLETVSAAAVMHNPGTTTSDAIIAHLANDGGTVYAVWSDEATGDVKLRVRTEGSGWNTESQLWDSGANAAWYTYVDVITRGGTKRVGYVYDVTHTVDISDLKYNEFAISAATQNGVANLTSTSTLSASGTAISIKAASAALVSTSTLGASGVVTKLPPANLVSTSSLTVAGVRAQLPSVALVSTSVLAVSASSFSVVAASAALTSSSILTVGGVVTRPGSVSLVSTSTLSATGATSSIAGASASLVSTSSLVVAGLRTQLPTAALVSTSVLAVSGIVSKLPSVALVSTSSLSVTGLVTKLPSVSLVSTSTLSASGTATGLSGASVNLTSVSSLEVTALRLAITSVALTSTSTLSAASVVTKLPSVVLTSTSVLAVSAVISNLPSATLVSTSTLAVGALATRLGSVALVSQSTLTLTGIPSRLGQVSLVSTSVLSVSAVVTAFGTASVAMVNTSTLFISAVRASIAAVNLVNTSTLVVTGTTTQFAGVGLTSVSVLAVSAGGAVVASALFTSTSSLSVTAAIQKIAVVNLSSNSVLSIGATRERVATVGLVSTSTLSTAGVRQLIALATLISTSALMATPRATYASIANLISTSILLVSALAVNTSHVYIVSFSGPYGPELVLVGPYDNTLLSLTGPHE